MSWLQRLRQLILLLPPLVLACGPGLPDMRRLDVLITSAETTCKSTLAEPKPQKLSICRRALACIEPAKKAQHAVQDMLLTMAKMEDSADDRLSAGAAYAGAVAACGVAGFTGVVGVAAKPANAKAVAAAPQPQNAVNAIVDRVMVAPTPSAATVPLLPVPVAAPVAIVPAAATTDVPPMLATPTTPTTPTTTTP